MNDYKAILKHMFVCFKVVRNFYKYEYMTYMIGSLSQTRLDSVSAKIDEKKKTRYQTHT